MFKALVLGSVEDKGIPGACWPPANLQVVWSQRNETETDRGHQTSSLPLTHALQDTHAYTLHIDTTHTNKKKCFIVVIIPHPAKNVEKLGSKYIAGE